LKEGKFYAKIIRGGRRVWADSVVLSLGERIFISGSEMTTLGFMQA
jgi:hypothetical protein